MFLCQICLFEMCVGALLAMIAAALGFAGPIVIKRILIFINSKSATITDQNDAYYLVTTWIALYFLRIFLK